MRRGIGWGTLDEVERLRLRACQGCGLVICLMQESQLVGGKAVLFHQVDEGDLFTAATAKAVEIARQNAPKVHRIVLRTGDLARADIDDKVICCLVLRLSRCHIEAREACEIIRGLAHFLCQL